MSSLVSATAPVTSIAAGSNQGVGANQAAAGNNNAATNAATQGAGQAAVVSLSASSKNRGISTGSERQVDASFEKQSATERGNGKDKQAVKKSVDVEA